MKKYFYNLATDKYKGFVPRIIKVFLFILSIIYGLLVRILILFYRRNPSRLDCKVISVGNITLGGTGKTSLVEYIARYLKQKGHKVAILSRGYKRKTTNHEPRTTNHETMGDEPYMLSKNLGDIPVIVDADRARAAGQAVKDYQADTVILDDGFQQWKIKKELEIVTINAKNPFGNRHLIPRGILREPLASLRRADIFVLTKTNLKPDIQELKDFLNSVNPRAPIFESIHKPKGFYEIDKPDKLFDTEVLKNKTVTLFSGIAAPDSFEDLIISLGINIGLSFRFPDHHNYSPKDLDEIVQASKKKDIDTIVTTEKDAARFYEPCPPKILAGPPCVVAETTPAKNLGGSAMCCGGNHEPRILVLRIELEIKDEQGFYSRLLGLYSL